MVLFNLMVAETYGLFKVHPEATENNHNLENVLDLGTLGMITTEVFSFLSISQ